MSSSALAAPPAPPPLKITGWKTINWGDKPDAVKRKVDAEGLLACEKLRKKKDEKGRRLSDQYCQGTPKDESGLRFVLMIYMNDELHRLAINYQLRPGEAKVANLEAALTKRYCPLTKPLNAAMLESKLGNSGQTQQVHLGCTVAEGDLYLEVENHVDTSDILILLSSDAYNAFLKENEFAKSF